MSGDAGTLLLGRYRVLRRLGVGGMATVVLAEDERLRRRVAVKRLHADSPKETITRLEREARVGASLNHPNIVAVYDTAADEDGVLIVMEYVDGEPLSATLRRGPLGPDRTLEVVEGVAAALDHAHRAGVVHRDVKPGNVLLGADGRIKLVDLGIARAAEHTRLTQTGTVLGTATYMAPEQLEGRPVGPAADTYALAAVAFEALSGRRARTGRTPVEVAHRIVSEPPPDLRDVVPTASAAVAATLTRAMARDPAARPRSAGELARELRRALAPAARQAATPVPDGDGRPAGGAATATAGARVPGPATDPRARRRSALARRAAIAALAIALGAVGVAVVAGGGDGGTEEDRAVNDRGAATNDGERRAGETPTPAAAGDDGATGSSLEPLFAPDGVGDPTEGASLNAQGKALIDQGSPEAAVPILLRAVRSFPDGTGDIEYAYALFNLGQALRLSGRAEEAVPVLERRLQIPDQRGVVRRELELARAAAG